MHQLPYITGEHKEDIHSWCQCLKSEGYSSQQWYLSQPARQQNIQKVCYPHTSYQERNLCVKFEYIPYSDTHTHTHTRMH